MSRVVWVDDKGFAHTEVIETRPIRVGKPITRTGDRLRPMETRGSRVAWCYEHREETTSPRGPVRVPRRSR